MILPSACVVFILAASTTTQVLAKNQWPVPSSYSLQQEETLHYDRGHSLRGWQQQGTSFVPKESRASTDFNHQISLEEEDITLTPQEKEVRMQIDVEEAMFQARFTIQLAEIDVAMMSKQDSRRLYLQHKLESLKHKLQIIEKLPSAYERHIALTKHVMPSLQKIASIISGEKQLGTKQIVTSRLRNMYPPTWNGMSWTH